MNELKISVCIPCYNEATSIGLVVEDFKQVLPDAEVWVYDNNSNDKTIEVAQKAGALVGEESRQGKGNVVRRMFADIEADIYVLVDGDNTYEASAAPKLIQTLLENNLDMVTGCRVTDSKGAYRPGHKFGNWMLTGLVATIFGKRTKDMLSGYRVFSRRFVKSFPALSNGFEIETELTVHALELRMPVADVDTVYGDRLLLAPESVSAWVTVLENHPPVVEGRWLYIPQREDNGFRGILDQRAAIYIFWDREAEQFTDTEDFLDALSVVDVQAVLLDADRPLHTNLEDALLSVGFEIEWREGNYMLLLRNT